MRHKRQKTLLGLCSVAVLATACAEPTPEAELGAVHQALEGDPEETPGAPVMVTSGTCKSNGFKPIDNQAHCTQAFNTIFSTTGAAPVSGPLDTANDQGAAFGCSLTVATGAQGREIRSSFGAGSQPELNGQACSHDIPCVCEEPAVDENDPLAQMKDVCKDGVFTPDPSKYYTIRSPQGRYLRGRTQLDGFTRAVILTPLGSDARDPYEQPFWVGGFFNLEFAQLKAPSDSRLHWRFQDHGDGYLTISRHLGEQLISKVGIGAPDNLATTFVPDLEGGTGLELMPYPSNPRPFSFRCVGRQVVLTQNGRSPVDNGGLFPADHDANQEISPPFVLTEPQSPGYVVRKTGCEGKSGTCVSHFGSGFVQIRRDLCGWFDSREVLTCKKQLDVPVSMHVPQGWYIEEVESFRHALDFEAAPVVVAPLVSDSGVANSLAGFGRTSADKLGAARVTVLANSAKLAGPLYGAMFSIAFNGVLSAGDLFGPNEADPLADLATQIDATLNKLAADMDERAAALVEDGIIKDKVASLIKTMGSRRRKFMIEDYASKRKNRLAFPPDLTEAQTLVTNLEIKVGEYDTDMDDLFPNIEANTTDQAKLKQAHYGLNVAKLAMTELLIMAAEAALMDAVARPGQSCDQVIDSQNMQSFVDRFTKSLQDAQQALITFGASHPERRTNLGHGFSSAFEFEFDVKNLSYPIEDQLTFFSTIVADTHQKCLRLRQPEDPFLEHFIANTPPPPAPEAAWPQASQIGAHGHISEPVIGDVDGDGDLDVVTRHHNPRRIVAWVNTDGALAESHALAAPTKPLWHDLPDLDGDGDLDLVLGGESSARLAWAENLGGSYAGATIVADNGAYSHVLAMRVDGDQLPDLVAFDKTNSALVLALNNSGVDAISLAAPTLIDSLSSNAFLGPGMAAVDIDSDDDLDLVLSLDDELSVYENSGGSFLAPTTIDTVGFGSFLFAADLDQDGDTDIVGVRGTDVLWYENLGNGSFGAEQTIVTGSFDERLAVGDLDGDGDSDIVLYDTATGELVPVENTLHGLFVQGALGTIDNISGLAIGDLDGDGDGDLVATSASNEIVAFSNPLRSPSVE